MIITVLAQKGEQSKTTTAVNIMAASGRGGFLVDLDDQQCDASKYAPSMPAVEFMPSFPKNPKRTDLIVVDTSPRIIPVTMEALAVSNLVIIPVTPRAASLEALARTFDTIDLARDKNQNLIARVVFTQVDRTQLTAGMIMAAEALSAWPVARTKIPNRKNDFDKAFTARRPIVFNSPRNAGAVAYRELVGELFNNAK